LYRSKIDIAEDSQMNTNPGDGHLYVGVASSNGTRVNCHLGEVDYLLVYDAKAGKPDLVSLRKIPPELTGDARWTKVAELVEDCSVVLVGGVGPLPRSILTGRGLQVRIVEGRIPDLLAKIDEITASNDDVSFVCGESCHGNGRGCGCFMA
jgi:nitrogen fixation protein NifB